jgi:hypothetical protein
MLFPVALPDRGKGGLSNFEISNNYITGREAQSGKIKFFKKENL